MSTYSRYDWFNFFVECGIPQKSAEQYADLFTEHRVNGDMFDMLDKDFLKEIGISVMGDVISILKSIGRLNPQSSTRTAAAAATATAITTTKPSFQSSAFTATTSIPIASKRIVRNAKTAITAAGGAGKLSPFKTATANKNTATVKAVSSKITTPNGVVITSKFGRHTKNNRKAAGMKFSTNPQTKKLKNIRNHLMAASNSVIQSNRNDSIFNRVPQNSTNLKMINRPTNSMRTIFDSSRLQNKSVFKRIE